MKVKKFFAISIIFLSLICTSCMQNKMTKVDDKKDVIISVNKKVGSLTFLDLNDLHKIAEWKLNRDISGAILLNHNKDIAVFHPSNANIDIYRLSTGEKINSWKVKSGITNMIALEKNKMVAITNEKENSISFFSDKGNALKKMKIGKNPISMVEDPIHQLLYVSLFNERKVIGINLENFKIEKSIEVPLTSLGLILNHDASELYIGGHGNGEEENEDVKVYSTRNGVLQKSLHTPLMPISFFKNEDGLYTVAHGTNLIYKLNPSSTKQNEFIEIGSNPYSAIGFKHSAFVASYDLNKLYKINTLTMNIEKEAAVGRGPFQLLLREGIRHE
jgi:DNA-binding beta-propeller fold protein YncE